MLNHAERIALLSKLQHATEMVRDAQPADPKSETNIKQAIVTLESAMQFLVEKKQDTK